MVSPEDRPPFSGFGLLDSWRKVYVALMIWLGLMIVTLWFFTESYRP
jgi:hypothetical protein